MWNIPCALMHISRFWWTFRPFTEYVDSAYTSTVMVRPGTTVKQLQALATFFDKSLLLHFNPLGTILLGFRKTTAKARARQGFRSDHAMSRHSKQPGQ